MDSDISSSGIISTDSMVISGEFTDVTLIPSAGYSLMRKAKRYGRWWVLKSLKDDFRNDPLYRQLLNKEFEILVSLDHPNIVKAFEWGTSGDDSGCIVMEYVDGMSLKEFMKSNPDREVKIKVVNELVDALEYIHSKQITHRDLKPSNILITNNGRNVKLIDFGLSDTDSYSILKQPAGTENYISPEQRESRVPDVRNDIYSLGRIIENLNISKAYNRIAHKCMLPITRRYGNMAALRKDIEKIGRNRWMWHAVAAVVLAGIVYGVFSYIMSTHPSPVVVEENGQRHEYVDMGNGLKVATCNVGAENPWDLGDWYAWAETEPYYEELNPDGSVARWKQGKEAGYDWPSYKYCDGSNTTLTKYTVNKGIYPVCDGKSTIEPGDDAATVNWGKHWRMMTQAECLILQNDNYQWTWSTYSDEHPVNGYWVENKKTRARIFLPAAGYRYFNNVFCDAGDKGYYWSSTINQYYNYLGFSMEFYNKEMTFHNFDVNRHDGRSVRAVYIDE